MVAAGRLIGIAKHWLAPALLALGVCPAPLAEEEPFEVRVQLKWSHQFQFAGYYAALEQGFYRDAGLKVSLKEPQVGHTPIDKLLMGRAHFAVADTGALIYRSTGVPLVALGAILQSSPSILITRDDGTVRSLEDLRGRRVMLGGGYMNAELIAMFRNAGIEIDQLVLVPSRTTLQPFIEGELAAHNGYTTNEPYELMRRGIDIKTFAPGDYGVNFYGDVLLTTETMIDAHPLKVEAFWQATRRGWEYAIEHPQAVVDLILRDYNTQHKSRAHLQHEARELIDLIMHQVVPIGYMNIDRWRHIEQVFRRQGLLLGPTDLDAFIYQAPQPASLADRLHRHRWPLAMGALLVLGLGWWAHSLWLRAQVRVRTRELQQATQLAEVEARTDHLTGLPNRRYFLETLARNLAQARRDKAPLALIFIDLDLFKRVNDRHGHAAGDEALRQTGALISAHLRQGDMAARIGGEEFAVACLNTDESQALALAQRLCEAMATERVYHGGEIIALTLSIGVATRAPEDGVAELLRKSDYALYQAKEAGRNCVRTWSGEAT